MVYVGFFGGSRPCLAEVSDWLAVAVKNELSKAIRASPSCLFIASLFAHRFAAHLDTVSVVHQAVQDGVSQRGIADLLVPARDWQLRGQDHRAGLVAILRDLPEVPSLRFRHRCHGPVID